MTTGPHPPDYRTAFTANKINHGKLKLGILRVKHAAIDGYRLTMCGHPINRIVDESWQHDDEAACGKCSKVLSRYLK